MMQEVSLLNEFGSLLQKDLVVGPVSLPRVNIALSALHAVLEELEQGIAKNIGESALDVVRMGLFITRE